MEKELYYVLLDSSSDLVCQKRQIPGYNTYPVSDFFALFRPDCCSLFSSFSVKNLCKYIPFLSFFPVSNKQSIPVSVIIPFSKKILFPGWLFPGRYVLWYYGIIILFLCVFIEKSRSYESIPLLRLSSVFNTCNLIVLS